MADGGRSILLEYRNVKDMQNYIKEVYLHNVQEAQCELQYVKIEIIANIINDVTKSVKR